MSAVEVIHVKKSFGPVQAVRDVSFEVHAGEIFGLLGPNGAGKTTTIRMMLNIFRPDAGSINILGGPMNEEKKANIGYMPEDRGLYRDLPLTECLVYLAMLKGMSRPAAETSVRSYLERLDLADSANKKVKELSRGMQQKAQIIATLAHDPRLLIMDEPFAGLDPVNTRRMKDLLREERAQGKAIIMSTHQMQQVEEMCDRILLINRGEGVLYGNLAEIKERYAGNAVRVQVRGEMGELPGVTNVSGEDGAYRLGLGDGVRPQEILAALCRRPDLQVESFEAATPSLEDVFVNVVSGSGGGPSDFTGNGEVEA